MENKRDRIREALKQKKRIVIKIGSSSLTYPEGGLDLVKAEKLVRILTSLCNQGKEVVLVSSGAVAVGRKEMGLIPQSVAQRQALAAVGQAKLMMIYQKLFAEYGQTAAQVLMGRHVIMREKSCQNIKNTFQELLQMGVIPVVNENDTVATYEIEMLSVFGDNDHLSACVAALIRADLLILLSDIDGLFTDDPKQNPDAELISYVPKMTEELFRMGKSTSSSAVGTGGMFTKLDAARLACDAGTDMVIANGDNVSNILKIIDGQEIGTWFAAHPKEGFVLADYMDY